MENLNCQAEKDQKRMKAANDTLTPSEDADPRVLILSLLASHKQPAQISADSDGTTVSRRMTISKSERAD